MFFFKFLIISINVIKKAFQLFNLPKCWQTFLRSDKIVMARYPNKINKHIECLKIIFLMNLKLNITL